MSIINKSFLRSGDNLDQHLAQNENRTWWETRPMTYDWDDKTLDSEEFNFQKIDQEFFTISKEFAHPNYPAERPFNRLIPYSRINNSHVLEIGCGMGSHAALLAGWSASYSGIDITERAVRATTKRLEQLGHTNVSVTRADAQDLPFADNSFDYVWSWGVIHHSAETEKVVDEIHRCLRPGGSATIMIYNKNSIRYYWYGLYTGIFKLAFFKYKSLYDINMSYTDGFIARHYSKRQARALFRRFNDIKFRVADCGVPSLGFGWHRLSANFPRMAKPVNSFLNNRFGWFLIVDIHKAV